MVVISPSPPKLRVIKVLQQEMEKKISLAQKMRSENKDNDHCCWGAGGGVHFQESLAMLLPCWQSWFK